MSEEVLRGSSVCPGAGVWNPGSSSSCLLRVLFLGSCEELGGGVTAEHAGWEPRLPCGPLPSKHQEPLVPACVRAFIHSHLFVGTYCIKGASLMAQG